MSEITCNYIFKPSAIAWWWQGHGMEMLSLLVLCGLIHQWLMDSPHKGPVIYSFDVFFAVNLNRLLGKQSSCQWVEMPWCSCDVTVMTHSLDEFHRSLSLFFFFFCLELKLFIGGFKCCWCCWLLAVEVTSFLRRGSRMCEAHVCIMCSCHVLCALSMTVWGYAEI